MFFKVRMSVARPVIRMSRIGGGSIEVSTSPASWAATIASATALRAASILAWTSGGIGGSGGSVALGASVFGGSSFLVGSVLAESVLAASFAAGLGLGRLDGFLDAPGQTTVQPARSQSREPDTNETASVTKRRTTINSPFFSVKRVSSHARGMESLVIFQVPIEHRPQFRTFGNMWFSPSLPVVLPLCQGHRARTLPIVRISSAGQVPRCSDLYGPECQRSTRTVLSQ